MMCNNPNAYLVNMNVYIKFGKILSICSQDIEWKRNFGVNQGPKHWYKCAKNEMYQSQRRSCQYEFTYKFVKFYQCFLKKMSGIKILA